MTRKPIIVRAEEPHTEDLTYYYVERLAHVDRDAAEAIALRAAGAPVVEGLAVKNVGPIDMVELPHDQVPDGLDDYWVEAEDEPADERRAFWRVELDLSNAILDFG